MTAPVTSTVLRLVSEQDWIELQFLFTEQLDRAAANIIEQIRAAGGKSAVLEHQYLDRDYSEEYAAFYAKLFHRHQRRTRRIHFFRTDLEAVFQKDGLQAVIAGMQQASEDGDYLGFVILRPVEDAPIGRAVLNVVKSPEDLTAHVQVRAEYEAHPLGTSLRLRGMPFTQQDQRISACAQASIWMTGRHFSTRHNGPWFSTVAINEAASKPTDMIIASSVPAGSSGLSVNNMLRALRAMDRFPYVFAADVVDDPNDNDLKLVWPSALSPEAILSRYVGSGIPVIIELLPWESGKTDSHAVVVVGDTFKPLENLALHASHPTVAELSPYFLVHDDQRGINLRMPVLSSAPDGETPYNVRDHLHSIIIPLPDKVFTTAETAEIRSWDRLKYYLTEWPDLQVKYTSVLGGSLVNAKRVIDASERNQIVSRTYLTYGWKYKNRLIEQEVLPIIAQLAAVHELPRMVWVTEFYLLEDLNHKDPSARRIFGHCVVDATSTSQGLAPLVVHMPGFLWFTHSEAPDFYPRTDETLYPLTDDITYKPRIRRDG